MGQLMKLSALWKSLIGSSCSPGRRRLRAPAPAPWITAEVLEHRTLLSNPAHDVSLTVVNGDITLKSVDTASHLLTVTRSGGNVVFTGGVDGTQITFGASTLATQIVAIPTVGKITITTNTGNDTYTINDLSTTGSIVLTGAASGTAELDVRSTNADVTIGGAIQGDFGKAKATLVATSLVNKTLTVNGAVTFKDAGNNFKAMHLGTNSGQVHLKSAVTYTDSGAEGFDSFEIFGKIAIDGKVTYSSARNTDKSVGPSVSVHDVADGIVPVLNGGLSVTFGQGDNHLSLLSSFDNAPLVLNGPVKVSSHGGFGEVHIERTVFKDTFTINSPAPASVFGGLVFINGSEFDGAVKITMGGTPIELLIGNQTSFATPTRFKSTVTMKLTGPGVVVQLSNANAGPQVIFDSTLSITGGTPHGTLNEVGQVSIGAGQLKLKKFTGP